VKIAKLAAFALAFAGLLAGCGTHVDCNQVRHSRIAGQNSAQIASSMGVSQADADSCY
jgi:hypothetical protein